jgi:predicted ArsR family transcriptional regulator
MEDQRGESQARILRLLRRSAESIASLAAKLDLSANVVRLHLASLVRDGLARPAGVRKDTGGKPAGLFEVTPDGDELFPKAYAAVLGAMVEEVAREHGVAHAIALLQSAGRRVGRSIAAGGDREVRVATAADALRSLGADVEVVREPDGWLLQGFACPLSQVTAQHPEVCELARSLVEEIVGGTVSECCDRRARPRCQFRVM